jgi:hypothetical protein
MSQAWQETRTDAVRRRSVAGVSFWTRSRIPLFGFHTSPACDRRPGMLAAVAAVAAAEQAVDEHALTAAPQRKELPSAG